MVRRLAVALTLALLVLARPAVAAEGEAPTVGTPAFTAVNAAAVSVSVSVDTHDAATVVAVEYVTAGAYRGGPGARVPSAATTVTVATVPASPEGPTTVTGRVTGLDPGSTYRMRVTATNATGETLGSDVTVRTPSGPTPGFRAKVGKDTTKVTRLTVGNVMGGETVRVTCRSAAKGCPFAARTVTNVVKGTLPLSPLVKRSPLAPGARLTLQVLAYGEKLSSLTLIIRDDQQPKVKRG